MLKKGANKEEEDKEKRWKPWWKTSEIKEEEDEWWRTGLESILKELEAALRRRRWR